MTPEAIIGPCLMILTGPRNVAERTEQRREEREPDRPGAHVASAKEIVFGGLDPPRIVPAHQQHPGTVESDGGPVEPCHLVGNTTTDAQDGVGHRGTHTGFGVSEQLFQDRQIAVNASPGQRCAQLVALPLVAAEAMPDESVSPVAAPVFGGMHERRAHQESACQRCGGLAGRGLIERLPGLR